MNSNEIRQKFLEFFEKRNHKVVASDSLIPSGDPTLLFTSAGMVQFKNNFLGQSKDTFKRASTCQKCFRTSDMDQVGKTNRHLTFFEMLGNFSFGDYFKKEAIEWAWEFLTKEIGLDADKMYATVYKNDDEAYEIWKKIVPESKIIRLGDETNFWNMGPTGPCGPCSEILFDLGKEMSCGKPDCGPSCSCNRYLEVWNLVFTQFDRQENGELKNLPRKNIDTGMGLERLVAVANNKKNIFETDLFVPIIKKLVEILEIKLSGNEAEFRMMADHCRAICFLISDGILPSNEGRGYVLRRILRRALRQGKKAGYDKPFLYKAAAQVCEIMGTAYPELKQRRENIASITKMEEENFLETIEEGTVILEGIIKKYMPAAGSAKPVIPGNEVFKLYDTYGFPFDLTKEIAMENGFEIDERGFLASQKLAQEKSRAAWSGSGEKDVTFYSQLHKEFGDTPFCGYDKLSIETEILSILQNGKKQKSLKSGQEGEVILKETPFYAESGGQVGDTGNLKLNGKIIADVLETSKPIGGLIIHRIKVNSGEISQSQSIEAVVDTQRRQNIMSHHTATHLLHKALRTIIGTHVTQAGSLVTPDYFRFDFTHLASLKQEEILAVEDMVNNAVRENMQVSITQMSIDDARKAGAMALFGEKYGQNVRAVSVKHASDQPAFSMELCGGTHVQRTGDIGMFKIISESSIASGTRRIEAVVGVAAEKYVRKIERDIEEMAFKLKTSKSELANKIDRIIVQQKEYEKEISRLKSQLAGGETSDLLKNVLEVRGIKVLSAKVSNIDVKSLRDLADNLKNKLGSGIVVLANTDADKISFIVTLTNDLSKSGYDAGKIAKAFARLISGSGGGKPDFAQGGGKDIGKLDIALSKIPELIGDIKNENKGWCLGT